MNPLVSIDGFIGWVVVASPLAVLAIIALAVLWAGRSKRKDTSIEFDSHEGRGLEPVSPVAADTGGGVAAVATVAGPPGRPAVADAGEPIADAAHFQKQREQITTALAEAERAGERGRQALLYLSLALLERKAGDDAAAGELLRKSVVLASETGNAVVHARGRLELGDLAQGAGDLTMACEHWQMARSLFDLAELADEKVDVDSRMQRNGCPTDWVLTDF